MQKPKDFNFSLIPSFVLNDLVRLYGLTNCTYVPFLGVGEYIFSISVLSDTSPKSVIVSDQGTFFVKQIPWYAKNQKQIQNRMDFLYELQVNDIPLPHLLFSNKNKKFVKIEDNFYYLTELIQNRGLKKDNKIGFSLGENLAKLHSVSSAYSLTNNINHHSESIIESCIKLSELLSPEDCFFVKEYTKNIDLFNYESVKFLVHGDINPSNILFAKNEVSGFVDFDNVIIDNPVRDLAEAIVTFCIMGYYENTSNIKQINNSLNKDLATNILEGYKKIAPHIFIKFKHLMIPAIKIILLEMFLISKLRGFLSKNAVYTHNESILNEVSELLNKTEVTQGIHIVDTFEKNENQDLLLDGKNIVDVLKNKVSEVNLHIIKADYHNFDLGYTLYIILEESHITLHSWPKENKLHLDIFVCNYSCDNTEKAYQIFDFLKQFFSPKLHEKQVIFRK